METRPAAVTSIDGPVRDVCELLDPDVVDRLNVLHAATGT